MKYKLVSWILKIYILFVLKTNRISLNIPYASINILKKNQQCLLLFWHSRIAIMPAIINQISPTHKFSAVVSQHRDGEYLSHFIQRFKYESIRGSSNKGAIKAMSEIIINIKKGNSIAITPDGPRGPAMKIGGSVVVLAQKYGIPIIYMSYAASKFKELNSWDRFLLPLPFGKITIVCSEPWILEKDQDKMEITNKLENFMQKQQREVCLVPNDKNNKIL